jgi:hypothetical protein
MESEISSMLDMPKRLANVNESMSREVEDVRVRGRAEKCWMQRLLEIYRRGQVLLCVDGGRQVHVCVRPGL